MSSHIHFRPLRHRASSLLTSFVWSLLSGTPRTWSRAIKPRARSLPKVPIDMLHDDALMEIFYFCMNDPDGYTRTNEWLTLAHVCRRWRYIVFAAPHHLNLRLEYTGMSSLKILDAWPVLPVVISEHIICPGVDHVLRNKATALNSEYHRISGINLSSIPNSHLETITAAMQKLFPELTHLFLSVKGEVDLVIPDSFLGGSAPHLRKLRLRNCPFPGMQKLLLSAKDLVVLHLWDIPDSGYVSPDSMVTALSVMTRLETLQLEFRSPLSRPEPQGQRLPLLTRVILPALTKLTFKGVREYSEDLMAQIDAPLLDNLHIILFMVLIFDVPQFSRFVGQIQEFKSFRHAKVTIDHETILCILSTQRDPVGYHKQLKLEIRCREVDWQLSSLAQICSSSSPLISIVKHLSIWSSFSPSKLDRMDDMDDLESENAQWLELLDSFRSVRNLTLSSNVAPYVCHALRKLGRETVTAVLPALKNVFLLGHQSPGVVLNIIRPFVAARRLSGHPITVNIRKSSRSKDWMDITQNLFSRSFIPIVSGPTRVI